MPAKNKRPSYNAPHLLYVIAPVVLVPAGLFMLQLGSPTILFAYTLQLFTLIDVIVISVGQIKYLRRTAQKKRLINQAYLLLAALFVPFLAIVAGDFGGSNAYGTALNGFGDMVGLIIGAVIMVLFAYGCVVANEIHIRHKKLSPNVVIVGKVFYWIGYIIVAFVSWIAYGITYSLHDPSTE